ncbi:MAG TPA: GNAT family protein [Ktedonobacterales bacterium]
MSTLSLSIRVDDEIELRLNEPRFAHEINALTNRNIAHLRPWMPWADHEQTLDDTLRYLEVSMRSLIEGTGLPTNLWYQGQLAGSIGYPRMSWEKRFAEIGYWLDKDLQGRGIITRAARALTTYAITELGLNKVEIHAAAGNTASRAVPERLGFTQEGVIRQSVWLNGQAHDLVIYGMIAGEWQP